MIEKVFLLIILILSFGCGLGYSYGYTIEHSQNLFQNLNNFSIQETAENLIDLNYVSSNEKHWSTRDLAYSIEGYCPSLEVRRIQKAFSEIEKGTNNTITFSNESSNPNIKIYCNQGGYNGQGSLISINDDGVMQDSLTSGLAGVTTSGNEIIEADINFYQVTENSFAGICSAYPTTEIHEILHTLGFDHNESSKSIMRPVEENCLYKIDGYILDKLVEIYK